MIDTNSLPEYVVMDPTGNITILVIEDVPSDLRKSIAAEIMRREPDAEQLGFISHTDDADIMLEMAGGEFCGNASMCAAAYFASENNIECGEVSLIVSGTDETVIVSVSRENDGSFSCDVTMPDPVSIGGTAFSDGNIFPVVHFPGIDHIICLIEKGYRPDKDVLEKDIIKYCMELDSPCTGLMLFDADESSLTPLVFVPGSDTLFWEHSCASGTAAIGAWMSSLKGAPYECELNEPGGTLKIQIYEDGKLHLAGTVKSLGKY